MEYAYSEDWGSNPVALVRCFVISQAQHTSEQACCKQAFARSKQCCLKAKGTALGELNDGYSYGL